ncbi:FTR1 family iron permease [Bifidobacterium scaligerum]|uniref:Iron permease n=1 Tax=Bifidobacterium scaligerum TaxID=2052656 RepID=A0A2M9HQD8_9BIFI|nr:FTR1 family protein [Bifidobacterium scaligerum]PJM79037.1 iron permease [Bifidobacterium scaligerum]
MVSRASSVIRRVLMSVVALVLALITVIALACAPAASGTTVAQSGTFAALGPSAAFADDTASGTSSATDYDTWTAIADAINGQLTDAQKQYADGNRSGAASGFSKAQNSTWNASNFSKVVSDTLGQDKYTAQLQQFQQLTRLAYQPDHQADIDSTVTALTADITASGTTLDSTANLAKPRDYAKARTEKTESERKTLDANKVNKNTGKGDKTWTDVANEMTPILDQALKDSQAGNGRKGADGVNNAYYQYYEKLGFEKNVMNAIGGDRVSKVESTFKKARYAMVDGDNKTAAQEIDTLKSMLVEDAGKLDGGAADNVNGFIKFVTSSIGQAFLVLIREGLEALLVVAAIIAYLIKSGNKRFVKWIYIGVLAGIAGAGVVAAIFMVAFGGSGPLQEIMEGVCALVAMAMLLWTSNWMLNKSSVEAWNRYIRTKAEAAVAAASTHAEDATKTTSGTVISLALLSFLAVFREGAETVIFYESIYSMTRDSQGMWIGGIAAAVFLVIIFLIIRFTSVKIPIGPFFLVTSILMSVLVVIFAGGGVHSLIEGDALSGMYLEGVPTNDWLGIYPYVETLVAQALAAVAVIGLFVVGFVKQRKAKAALAAGSVAKSGE